ncbi:MAG: hypothetical protein JSR87_12675 [Proteobacteria bacterium]|nr:hypothetical protein [Pseudomonadota bacterium]MBS0573875.1 hypothetical protein [Pseudomonadota bacterium]
MTHRIFLGLAGLILLALVIDAAAFHGAALLFLARKFVDLSDWVAFWR